ncbi:hypothetical protein FQR65_LT17234 [Abscondita terminalis]|nr:hypothetical protein FQR65_LT17234 [Abscondita terminalis]
MWIGKGDVLTCKTECEYNIACADSSTQSGQQLPDLSIQASFAPVLAGKDSPLCGKGYSLSGSNKRGSKQLHVIRQDSTVVNTVLLYEAESPMSDENKSKLQTWLGNRINDPHIEIAGRQDTDSLTDNQSGIIPTPNAEKSDGIARASNANETYFDGSPEWIRVAVENSLKRLKVDVIDLYYAHRVDPEYLCRRDCRLRCLSSEDKSEYSLLTRDVEPEILPLLKEMDIALVPYSPLARGLVTNTLDVNQLEDQDFRKFLPRYQGENLENNTNLAATFASFARDKGVSPAQLALAWVLAQGEQIIPIPGNTPDRAPGRKMQRC